MSDNELFPMIPYFYFKNSHGRCWSKGDEGPQWAEDYVYNLRGYSDSCNSGDDRDIWQRIFVNSDDDKNYYRIRNKAGGYLYLPVKIEKKILPMGATKKEYIPNDKMFLVDDDHVYDLNTADHTLDTDLWFFENRGTRDGKTQYAIRNKKYPYYVRGVQYPEEAFSYKCSKQFVDDGKCHDLLFTMIPSLRKCEVGPWMPDGECSKSCGKGTQKFKREIIQEPSSDENCPALTKTESCYVQPCDVDCKYTFVNEGCSKPCGGGVVQFRLDIHRNPAAGGEPCPTLDDAPVRECNTQPCKKDCKLGEWKDWEPCDCIDNVRERHKEVLVQPEHGGKPCPDEYQQEECECTPEPFKFDDSNLLKSKLMLEDNKDSDKDTQEEDDEYYIETARFRNILLISIGVFILIGLLAFIFL